MEEMGVASADRHESNRLEDRDEEERGALQRLL